MDDVIDAQSPSEEEKFFKKWGWETLKENITVLNDVLKLLLTISTAILAAYLGFYDKIRIVDVIVPEHFIKLTIVFLLINSLIWAIVGIFPFPAKVNLNMPQEVKSYKQKRGKRKGD